MSTVRITYSCDSCKRLVRNMTPLSQSLVVKQIASTFDTKKFCSKRCAKQDVTNSILHSHRQQRPTQLRHLGIRAANKPNYSFRIPMAYHARTHEVRTYHLHGVHIHVSGNAVSHSRCERCCLHLTATCTKSLSNSFSISGLCARPDGSVLLAATLPRLHWTLPRLQGTLTFTALAVSSGFARDVRCHGTRT